jgi:hypothetical protein
MSGAKRMFGRPIPPYFPQRGATCWAAALASWLATVPGRHPWTAAELVNYFSSSTVDGQMLDPKYLRQVLGDFMIRMDYDLVKGSNFTPAYAAEMLPWSNLYVITGYGASVSHARVVFGMTEDAVGVIDPMFGALEWNFSQLKSINVLLVGWAKGKILGETCKPDSGMGEYFM